MPKLSKAEMYALAEAHGVLGDLARIMLGGAWSESHWDTEAVGDQGHSIGLFQLHDQGMGAGYSVAERQDPHLQFEIMTPEYQREYDRFSAQGYGDENLAWRVCCWAEKPYDYTNPQGAAANDYRAGWEHAAPEEEPVPTTLIYDPEFPPRRQHQPWTCSVNTACWCLNAIGIAIEPGEMQDRMVAAGLVTPEQGLLDGTGTRLAAWLSSEFGVDCRALGIVGWEWLRANAGHGPIGLGSGSLFHWLAVRRIDSDGNLAAMNPAPGYRGVGDTIGAAQWGSWAPWYGIWIPVEADELSQEERDELAYLRSFRGLVQGDYATKLRAEVALARAARLKKDRNVHLDQLDNIANTLEQG